MTHEILGYWSVACGRRYIAEAVARPSGAGKTPDITWFVVLILTLKSP